ncbi:MAG TPA: protein phosphatase 2C domain-containing protein [Bryobacteraceae bacterium]|jgi:parallel beta-helix repeat protein|nr:protein phosphatase 2C domain-containing protein [Bryobacteraceae bacterium]
MKTATAWQAGVATHPGLERPINEDRVFADEAHGVFAVVDGLGGHAAGERAAETAVGVIAEHAGSGMGEPEERIRKSIATANNRICDLAKNHEGWRGMACVLTLAVVHGDRVTVGHVGDSRLYLIWNGHLRKLTSDHSPVGEMEDQGELTEGEAMCHPRRNEIFRDVGSVPHEPNDPEFIEVREFPLRPDAALLLCSDGLSDAVTSSQIRAIVERYDSNPEEVAQRLVEAANEAGGRDNVSVVFVPGPEFLGSESPTLQAARVRHGSTRVRGGKTSSGFGFSTALWFVGGVLLGGSLWAGYDHFAPLRPAFKVVGPAALPGPSHITVNAADPFGIVHSLTMARAGDTLNVPAGHYLGPIVLKSGVDVLCAGDVMVMRDPASATDAAIVANSVHGSRVKGLRIASDPTHPLKTGVLIEDSSIELDDADISGAESAGIQIAGSSEGELLANFIHGNNGPGVAIGGASTTRLAGNRIEENGRSKGAPHGGLEIAESARPLLVNNIIARNGLNTTGQPSAAVGAGTRGHNLMDAEARRSTPGGKTGAGTPPM